jgi:hypothetical protein
MSIERDIFESCHQTNNLFLTLALFDPEVWNAINRGQSERLQKLHNRCARIVMNFKDEPGQSQLASIN